MNIEHEAILMSVRNNLREAETCLNSGDYPAAKSYVERAIDIARAQEHTPSLAAAYYGMASVIWNSDGDSASAHHYASLAAQHTKANTTTDLLVRTLIARLKAARGNYDAAILLNEDLLKFYYETDNLAGIADILRSLGDVYCAMGQYDKARERYFLSLELHQGKINEPLNMAGLLLSIGSLYYRTDDPQQARRYWNEARNIAEANGYRHIIERVERGLELLDT